MKNCKYFSWTSNNFQPLFSIAVFLSAPNSCLLLSFNWLNQFKWLHAHSIWKLQHRNSSRMAEEKFRVECKPQKCTREIFSNAKYHKIHLKHCTVCVLMLACTHTYTWVAFDLCKCGNEMKISEHWKLVCVSCVLSFSCSGARFSVIFVCRVFLFIAFFTLQNVFTFDLVMFDFDTEE